MIDTEHTRHGGFFFDLVRPVTNFGLKQFWGWAS